MEKILFFVTIQDVIPVVVEWVRSEAESITASAWRGSYLQCYQF